MNFCLSYAKQEVEINEALEAEDSVFDKVGYILEGDRYFVSMVSHMVTPKLMEKPIVNSIIEILIDAVEKVTNENKEESDKEKAGCPECSKYKQVEEHKEAHITKIEKEKKHLDEKLRSMTGQKRYYVNKSNDLEAQLEEAKQRNKEFMAKISTMESLQSMRFVEPVPLESNSEAVPDVIVVEQVAPAPDNSGAATTIQVFKCRRCGE